MNSKRRRSEVSLRRLGRESLYHKIGGAKAVEAVVTKFYERVLADKEVNHFFEYTNMKTLPKRQKQFISAALGGPEPWTGKDMRKAHEGMEITEKDFNVIAGHLQAVLKELKVKEDHIAAIMKTVGSTKDAVLNRKPKKAAK